MRFTLAVVVFLLGACTDPIAPGGDGGGDDGGGADSPDDGTPPAIVSIVPTDGATGVESDAVVTITFSEPVNRNIAQGLTLSPVNVAYEWDESGTMLTLRPDAPLVYAASTDPDAPAREYTFSVSGALEDLAGNSAAVDASTTFSTLRAITVTIEAPVADMYELTSVGGVDQGGGAGAQVGDMLDSNNTFRSAMEFDLSVLPAGIVEIVGASLALELSLTHPTVMGVNWGMPFTELGALNVAHIRVITLDAASAFDDGEQAIAGTLTATDERQTVDVTAAVAADVADTARTSDYTQFRLQFAMLTNGDNGPDLVAVTPSTINTLEIEYLIP